MEEPDKGNNKYKRKKALWWWWWFLYDITKQVVIYKYDYVTKFFLQKKSTDTLLGSKAYPGCSDCIIAQIQHIYNSCRCVQLTSICGSRFLGFTVNISLILLCFNVSFFSSIFLWSQSGCLTLGTGFASCKEDK